MHAPLKHEADVPENKAAQKNRGRDEGGTRGAKETAEAIEQKCEAEDKEGGEEKKEAVAVRGDAGPGWIRRNEVVERDEDEQEGGSDAGHATPESDEADQS